MVNDHNIKFLPTKNCSVGKISSSIDPDDSRTCCCWSRSLRKCVTIVHCSLGSLAHVITIGIADWSTQCLHASENYARSVKETRLHSLGLHSFSFLRDPSTFSLQRILLSIDHASCADRIFLFEWECQCGSPIGRIKFYSKQQPIKHSERTVTRRSDQESRKPGGLKPGNPSAFWHHERTWWLRKKTKHQTGDHECQIGRRMQRDERVENPAEDCARSRQSSRWEGSCAPWSGS